MIEIELVPDSTHCVETIARREYRNLVNLCLQNEKDILESGQKIEVLRLFLESADFRKLRRDSERYLSTGQEVKFVLNYEHSTLTCRLFVNGCDTSLYTLSEDIS